MIDDFMEDPYEPDEQEIKELDEILREENFQKEFIKLKSNRIKYAFYTESHFAGWLKVNGIRW